MLSYLNWQSIYTNKKKIKIIRQKYLKKQNKNVFCSLTRYNVYANVTKIVAKLSHNIKSNNVYSASQMLYARL